MKANITKTKLFISTVENCAKGITNEANSKKISLNKFQLDSDFNEFVDPKSGWILPIEAAKESMIETSILLSGELKEEDILNELINCVNLLIKRIN